MEKANLTLYTVIGDFSRVAESMRVRFQDVTKMFTPEDDRWMILLQDDTMIRCSMMESGSQADQVAEHGRYGKLFCTGRHSLDCH